MQSDTLMLLLQLHNQEIQTFKNIKLNLGYSLKSTHPNFQGQLVYNLEKALGEFLLLCE